MSAALSRFLLAYTQALPPTLRSSTRSGVLCRQRGSDKAGLAVTMHQMRAWAVLERPDLAEWLEGDGRIDLGRYAETRAAVTALDGMRVDARSSFLPWRVLHPSVVAVAQHGASARLNFHEFGILIVN